MKIATLLLTAFLCACSQTMSDLESQCTKLVFKPAKEKCVHTVNEVSSLPIPLEDRIEVAEFYVALSKEVDRLMNSKESRKDWDVLADAACSKFRENTLKERACASWKRSSREKMRAMATVVGVEMLYDRNWSDRESW